MEYSTKSLTAPKAQTPCQVLLLEDDGIFRHAILMNVEYLFSSAEIYGFSRYDTLLTAIHDESISNMHQFDVAILDPGVPPITPPGSNTTLGERIDMISSVVARLRPDCNVVVLTGSYNTSEAKVMLDMGVNKYLSKGDIDLISLRSHLSYTGDEAPIPKAKPQKSPEKFVSGLTEKERFGLAVHLNIYNEAEVASALNVDIETIRKYVTRAKKRMRQR